VKPTAKDIVNIALKHIPKSVIDEVSELPFGYACPGLVPWWDPAMYRYIFSNYIAPLLDELEEEFGITKDKACRILSNHNDINYHYAGKEPPKEFKAVERLLCM